MTINIFPPHGAYITFEGCSKFQKTEAPAAIAFTYTARDSKGNVMTRRAAARFSLDVICGYSVEESEVTDGTA